MKNKFSVIVALLLMTLMSLTSCSRIDLAVNLANSYMTNKADDYFDLTRAQTSWLREALGKDIERVKKTIFPQLASEMLKAADTLSTRQSFDSNLVYSSYKRMENLFYQGLRVFTPNAVLFVEKLSPNQVAYFQKEFDKKAIDLKEEPEKKQYDKMKKQFDSWVGSVTSNQKKDIKNFVSTNPPPVQETVYNRQKMVHQFVSSDVTARKAFVEKLFTSYESLRESGYAKIAEAKNKQVASFVTSMLNKISAEQKKTLVDTIRDRANQLIKISKG